MYHERWTLHAVIKRPFLIHLFNHSLTCALSPSVCRFVNTHLIHKHLAAAAAAAAAANNTDYNDGQSVARQSVDDTKMIIDRTHSHAASATAYC